MKALPRGRAHRHGRSLTEVAEIDVLVHNAATRETFWPADNEGNPDAGFIEARLLPYPVLSEHLAVIGKIDTEMRQIHNWIRKEVHSGMSPETISAALDRLYGQVPV